MRAHRHLVAPGPLVALLLALSPGVGLAGAPVDPTAEEVAVAAMLQASDVQASATSEGVTVGDAGDLPGYTENGGLREVRQTWTADGGVKVVFDFRWQFPDNDAAAAFLDAAEEVLSEVSSGAERESLPRRRRPLPDTRLYTFEDRLFGTGTVGFNYLMRQDTLVAKVYVSGDKDELSQAVASKIAQAAADRIVAALAGAGPVSTPRVDQSPLPSPGGDQSPAPSPGVDDVLTELLSHVPVAVRDSCAPPTAADQEPAPDDQLAQVTCPMSDGGAVTFFLFDSVEAMDAAYDTAREYALVFGFFSTAGTCEDGGYDANWSLAGQEAGRLLCHELQGDASIVWSHSVTRILSMIRQPDRDSAAAWQLWLAAGPE